MQEIYGSFKNFPIVNDKKKMQANLNNEDMELVPWKDLYHRKSESGGIL